MFPYSGLINCLLLHLVDSWQNHHTLIETFLSFAERQVLLKRLVPKAVVGVNPHGGLILFFPERMATAFARIYRQLPFSSAVAHIFVLRKYATSFHKIEPRSPLKHLLEAASLYPLTDDFDDA